MKTFKRCTAVLLVLALALALTGCGFAAKMARAAKKMEKLQSYRMDLDMDMALKLSMLRQSMDMDMKITGGSDVCLDPSRTRTELRISMLGQEIPMVSYTDKTDAGLVTYSSPDGGKTWTRQTVESPELAEAAGKNGFSNLLRLAAGFEKTGTETVRGSEATVYSGVITGEDMERVMEMSGVLKNVFSSMDMSMDGLDLSQYGGIPTTISLDNKSGMVVRYTMDMTEFMGKMMPAMMDAVMKDAAAESGLGNLDLSTLGFSVETGRVFAAVELYDFDAVGAIEIPAEALSAPEAAA